MKKAYKQIWLALTITVFLSACNRKKEIRLIGFAYRNENIIVRSDQHSSRMIKVLGDEDKNRICLFNKIINLDVDPGHVNVSIIIDSSKIKVLDTVVIVTRDYKKPFISFGYPIKDNNYKRHVFIGDESDSSFLKY